MFSTWLAVMRYRQVRNGLLPGNQVFQRIPVAVLGLRNQVEIGGFVDHFSKWIEHGCPSTVEEYLLLGHAESICMTILKENFHRIHAGKDGRPAITSFNILWLTIAEP